MKKILCLIGSALLAIEFAGCASFKSIIPAARQVGKTKGVAGLPLYSGSKAKIAVVDFNVKTTKASSAIGLGLREILVAALINSNRFNVIEHKAENVLKPEQDKIKTADLNIIAAVTEFKPQASGGRQGLGGGGGVGSGRLGGLLGVSLNKAHMVLDIRIVDVSTSKVLATTSVQAQAADVSGSIMTASLGNWALVGGLSAYANTPMEKAIRICIVEAVRYISQTIPAGYYKY